MIMRLLMLLLAAVMWLSACGGGQNATSAGTADHDVATVRSQNVLNEAIEAGAPGCSAAVGVNGKVVWTGVRGVADTSTGNAITTQTVFDIPSVSKQFTATALLLLVDAGKLTLDDPLSRYVPELPTWSSTVTVGQLMTRQAACPSTSGCSRRRGSSSATVRPRTKPCRRWSACRSWSFNPARGSNTRIPTTCCW